MALRLCPDCGQKVSTKAPACPKCGRILKRQPQQVGCCGAIVLLGAAGLIGLLVIGSLSPRLDRSVPVPEPVPSAPAPAPVVTPRLGAIKLTPADFGGRWPIEADSLVLSCIPSSSELTGGPVHLITAFVDGKMYAVNGTARGRMKNAEMGDFDELCPRDADGSFTLETVKFRRELIDRGLAICP